MINRMKTKIVLLGVLLILGVSCADYLDPYPNGDKSTEDIWLYQDMVQGLVGQCYDNMPRNYDNNEGAYLDCATDDAVSTSTTRDTRRMALGSLTPSSDPGSSDLFANYWTRAYNSIRLVNMFLKDRRGYNTKFIVPKLENGVVSTRFNDLVKNRLQGEAFALRAWFQWDLLQKFGGKGINGEMLGFPIVLEPIEIGSEVNLARNTYDECVKQILADCDSAYKYLPIAHRDFLVPNVADRAYAGGKYWGKMDGITTRAIKANVYLTWASPRFNPTNDISRWDNAAKFAKEVVDFKLNVDKVTGGFNPANSVNWFDPNSPEIVFSARFQGGNDAMERMFYPGGFQGNGAMGATQDFVDAFPMKNGYPITDPRSLYNPADPYKDRDPRFYSIIFYNGAQAKRNNTGAVMYTFENWSNGGKDAAGVKATNSLTNYHIKKNVFMGLNWSDASINRQPHTKMFIRWTHMVLAFAEAANKVVGPNDAGKYGLSAKAAMQYIRARKTYDGATMYTADPYLDEVAANATRFDEFVKNERRIETCFEGMRFFDLRRWTTNLDDLNKAVRMATITKKDDGTFTYDLTKQVEIRAYKSAYLPIPYNEILRMSNLVQNEGWESWK